MPTRVCITIDTEFSIAGAFSKDCARPVAGQMVWCNVDGQSHGLEFMLDCFKTNGVAATFFVEALQRYYFREDPMRSIARRIHAEGHEAQLHVHPCWNVFRYDDWRARASKGEAKDNFYGRDELDSAALIRSGVEIFNDWGIPKPKVFRSGNLQHDDALYRALAKSGIPYSSNIGLEIFNSRLPDYQLRSGCHLRHGVLECPILTYCDWSFAGRQHFKTLTITGTSFSEMRNLLEQAEANEVPLIVILTHPFEFIQSRDPTRQHARAHGINQRRLADLCSYLATNRSRFPATGLAEAVESIGAREFKSDPLLTVPLRHTVGRMASQVCYDQLGRIALGEFNKRAALWPT